MNTVTVIFGNNNRYTMKVPDDQIGKLLPYLLVPIDKKPTEVLYYILNGKLLGDSHADFDRLLSDLCLNSCMLHLIFKENIQYTESVLMPSARYNSWIKRNSAATEPHNLLNELFRIPLQMTDEIVLIPDGQYSTYVTVTQGSSNDNCSICAEPMTEGPLGTVNRCRHVFHDSCIKTHLVSQGSVRCPTCGTDVRD